MSVIQHDLFSAFSDLNSKTVVTKVDLPDSDIVLFENFISPEQSDSIYRELLEQTPWAERKMQVWNKIYAVPRLTAWYGDKSPVSLLKPVEQEMFENSYSKVDHDWTPLLYHLKEQVEAASQTQFTTVLLNLYRDGTDKVGWHTDRGAKEGKVPVIASLTFGQMRPFELRHRFDKTLKKVSIPLYSGTLLLMRGKTQTHWEHQIPATKKQIDSRINLTFRSIS